MNRNIIRLLLISVLLPVILISGCRPPPNGVILSKDILLKDTGITVNTETDASKLVADNLDIISGADLVRIDGLIDRNTLIGVTASKMEDNQYLVSIEYSYQGAQASCQIGKVAVTVTGEGKIYGTVRMQPD